MKIKYQRTSTLNQHGNRFEMDKSSYDLVLFDKGISGTKLFKDRPQASKIINLVESEQVKEFIVEEIRDIGRNMVDTINTLEWFDKHQVNVIIRSMGNLNSRVNGKKSEIWSLITSVMSSLYQMELENLKLRTKMGRDAYIINGGKLGRKVGSNESIKDFLEKPKSKKILSLLNQGKSVRDIAARVSCSFNLVIKVKHYSATIN